MTANQEDARTIEVVREAPPTETTTVPAVIAVEAASARPPKSPQPNFKKHVPRGPTPDWLAIEHAFVTDQVATLRDISRKFSVGYDGVQRRAQLGKWKEKRAEHWNSVAADIRRRAILTASKVASRQILAHMKGIEALRDHLIRRISAKDANVESVSTVVHKGTDGQPVRTRVRRGEPKIDEKFIDSIMRLESELILGLMNGTPVDTSGAPPAAPPELPPAKIE